MSPDNQDLSRVQRPVWDTERRYGETRNHDPDSPHFSLLINRMVFTPRKDPLPPPPVLEADGSQETSGASPCKRLSGQVCPRPLKPALISLRKLVSPDLLRMPYAEPAGDSSQETSGASLRKRLSGQLFSRPLKPALLSPRKLVSPDLWPMPHAEPRGIRSPASPPSLRCPLPAYRPLAPGLGNRAREYEMRNFLLSIFPDNLQTRQPILAFPRGNI